MACANRRCLWQQALLKLPEVDQARISTIPLNGQQFIGNILSTVDANKQACLAK